MRRALVAVHAGEQKHHDQRGTQSVEQRQSTHEEPNLLFDNGGDRAGTIEEPRAGALFGLLARRRFAQAFAAVLRAKADAQDSGGSEQIEAGKAETLRGTEGMLNRAAVDRTRSQARRQPALHSVGAFHPAKAL